MKNKVLEITNLTTFIFFIFSTKFFWFFFLWKSPKIFPGKLGNAPAVNLTFPSVKKTMDANLQVFLFCGKIGAAQGVLFSKGGVRARTHILNKRFFLFSLEMIFIKKTRGS